MKKRTQNGFTLYELLITLLVIGVVLALGIPNLSEFTRNSRITATANDLHAAFLMARGEAARAKTNITICASDNSMGNNPTCQGTWDEGYIVFVDQDGNLAVDGGIDAVLRQHGPVAEDVVLAVANDATYFSYAATGLGRGNVGGNIAVTQFIVCDDRGVIETSADQSAGRLVVATPLGRATVLRDYDLVSDALTDMGKTCP